jgi:hypothetical protein
MGKKSDAKALAERDVAGSEITSSAIEARAYEIHLSGTGGNDLENWLRAEAELRAEAHRETVTDELQEMHAVA